MSGHPEFLRILDEMRELHQRKAADYGRGQDPFANVRASAEFGIPAWVGVMVRAGDKLHRVKSFIHNGSLKNESLEDSLQDLAAYAIIALVLFREQQGAAPPARAAEPETQPPSSLKKRVYIAGPISKGDLLENIRQAEEAFVELVRDGFAPFCPHWSAFAGSAVCDGFTADGRTVVAGKATVASSLPLNHDDWLDVDLPWVAVADAVLRLPGESAGADREVALAGVFGIPVFTCAEALAAHFAGKTAA